MARLFPDDTDLSVLNEAERRVVDALLTGLDESWTIVPRIPITVDGRDSEIDIVLVSFDTGVFCVEVKGGVITLEGGTWKSNSRTIDSPAFQSMRAKHALVSRLRRMKVDLSSIFVQHLVAFPDNADFPDAVPDCPPEIVLTQQILRYPQEALSALRHATAKPVPREHVVALLTALRPDVTVEQVDGTYVKGVSQRLRHITDGNLAALIPLDANRRLFVEGAAGTGKTYLAHHWTRRALDRKEKTLLVCYNRALGDDLTTSFEREVDDAETLDRLTCGSFHKIANALLGKHAPAVPDDAGQEFWDTRHAELLVEHRAAIDVHFDTIIIDEAQDFQPSWFGALEGLLADPETSRFYLMTDPKQAIYAAPLQRPRDATVVPLQVNIRNTENIARLVGSLGGATIPPNASVGPGIDVFIATGAKERRKRIATALDHAHGELGIPLSQILVLVPHRADVDALVAEAIGDYTLVKWADRTEETVACGTIHGSKGLERPAVILVNMDEEINPVLTYIGSSRSSAYLALVGSQQFVDHVNGIRANTP